MLRRTNESEALSEGHTFIAEILIKTLYIHSAQTQEWKKTKAEDISSAL